MREVVGLSLEKDTSSHAHAHEFLSFILVYTVSVFAVLWENY